MPHQTDNFIIQGAPLVPSVDESLDYTIFCSRSGYIQLGPSQFTLDLVSLHWQRAFHPQNNVYGGVLHRAMTCKKALVPFDLKQLNIIPTTNCSLAPQPATVQ